MAQSVTTCPNTCVKSYLKSGTLSTLQLTATRTYNVHKYTLHMRTID